MQHRLSSSWALSKTGINHAALLYRKGDPARARAEFEKVLHDAEDIFGPDDQMVAQACNHLALLERDAGQFERAQSLAERALAIREKVFGPDLSWRSPQH